MSTTRETTLSAADEKSRDSLRQAIILIGATTLILTVIGVVMVFSATSVSSINEAIATDDPGARFFQAERQLAFALAGIALIPIAILFPPKFYYKAAFPLFILGILLQLLVLTPLQRSQGGNTNWIYVAGINIQPSEFLKLAAILFVAVALGKIPAKHIGQWRKLFGPVGGALASIGAVLAGGDLGTAIIYLLVFVFGFWIAGMPVKWFLIGGLIGITSLALLIVIMPSRVARITDYLENLWKLPDVYFPTQADYAMWAFGTGGFGGVGLGASREKWNYLAEAHNDFIFAVIGEELGLGGCLAIIILYLVLGYGLCKIVLHHEQKWVRYFTAMVAMWLIGQALLNMMVVTGVLPVFGVPLPFISQGGSAMISCLLAIGVVLSLALRHPGVMESFKLNKLSMGQAATIRTRS